MAINAYTQSGLTVGLKEHDENRQGEAYLGSNLDRDPNSKKFYLESYGCAMNFNDSEVVASILIAEGMVNTASYLDADLILINTCSIRENAEDRIRGRLREFGFAKKTNPNLMVGVLGCMAERLKSNLLEQEKLVDIVVGPDAYRDLPSLIGKVESGAKGVNVLLSRDETYADISPVRLSSNGVTAFVSITRGCNNMCSFCVVPFTRGRERSRPAASILKECNDLFSAGYREVTLLGQNVDSYHYKTDDEDVSFASLMEQVACINPLLRVRFSTSHPKDMQDDVLHMIAKYDNICNYIHLPVQHGNSRVLELMNRTYTREWYVERIESIRRIVPQCAISTDIITGFCTETEEDHQDTLSLMEWVGYEFAYMFFYSERPGTLAARKYADDIPIEVKKRRLAEVIELQKNLGWERNKADVGTIVEVLVEGESKRSNEQLQGRNSQNKMVVFNRGLHKKGDYVMVKIISCTPATLIGEAIDK
jgi:tRNA-2-methylthio-N6-dimethylallyladenosine synthase